MAYTPPVYNSIELNFEGSYTPPVYNTIELDIKVGNGWAAQTTLVFATSAPELLLIPWTGESSLAFAVAADLTDSNLLLINDCIFSLDTSAALAPSWYIRRPTVSGTRAGWAPRHRIEHGLTAPHTQATAKPTTKRISWDQLQVAHGDLNGGWNQIPFQVVKSATPWGDLRQHPAGTRALDYSHPGSKGREQLGMVWDDSQQQIEIGSALNYNHPPPREQADRLPWGDLTEIIRQTGIDYNAPPPKDRERTIFCGPVWYPRWCQRHYKVPPALELIFNVLGTYTEPAGQALIFNADSSDYEQECFDGTWNGPKDAYWYKPHLWDLNPQANIKRTYVIMNSVNLIRVSDSVAIPVENLSISTDMDSWAWKLSATLVRKTDLDLVRPAGGLPVEVEAQINGLSWRFLIEEYGEDAKWGARNYSISGRSLSATLAAPYTAASDRLEPAQRTAQQLAEDELVDSGWSIVWSLPDWLVPGGIYNYQQQTPVQSLLAIAASAGGVLHTDPTTQTLQMLPWYNTLPWEWGGQIVDAVVPESMIDSQRASYTPKPQYSGVYVNGQSQGVSCFVKRLGSSGSELAAQQVNQLITDTAPGLALGKKLLADSGPRETVTINLPLLADPGLLAPGQLIEVQAAGGNWRGQVTSVSIAAQRPSVWQTVNLLRYYGT